MLKIQRLILLAIITLAFVASGGGAACAGEPAAVDQDAFEHFVQELRRFHYDYEPSARPADLAREADLVVSGRVTGARPGQSYAPLPGERARIATTVLAVQVTQVLAARDSDLAPGATIYVELTHPAFLGTVHGERGNDRERVTLAPYDVAAFVASVPKVDGLFFLDDRTLEPYWPTVLNAGAGRPPGASLYAPYIQGLLLQGSDGVLVSVLEPLDTMPGAWSRLSSLSEVAGSVRKDIRR